MPLPAVANYASAVGRAFIFLNTEKLDSGDQCTRIYLNKIQDKSLFPHLDVLSNVAFGIRKKNAKNDIAKELLRLFRIEGCEKKFPNELSGGEQQRVALARSLAPEPQILLMDEPFNALDDDLKNDLYRETKNIIKKKEMTVLMVTHDKAESQIFSNKIINLENGKIRE